jgi:hypothetical protein
MTELVTVSTLSGFVVALPAAGPAAQPNPGGASAPIAKGGEPASSTAMKGSDDLRLRRARRIRLGAGPGREG